MAIMFNHLGQSRRVGPLTLYCRKSTILRIRQPHSTYEACGQDARHADVERFYGTPRISPRSTYFEDEDIERVADCTDMQNLFVGAHMQSPSYYRVSLDGGNGQAFIDRFFKAWQIVVDKHQIFRTAIVPSGPTSSGRLVLRR